MITDGIGDDLRQRLLRRPHGKAIDVCRDRTIFGKDFFRGEHGVGMPGALFLVYKKGLVPCYLLLVTCHRKGYHIPDVFTAADGHQQSVQADGDAGAGRHTAGQGRQ